MIKFGINEYIRNFWFNLCIVMLLLVMIIISTILISNIDEQTGPYRLSEKYIDDDSMFLLDVLSNHMEELSTYGEILAIQTLNGFAGENSEVSIVASIYTEEVMNYLKPSLDFGKYPENVKSDNSTIRVLISHNPYGFKVGDTFTYYVYTTDGKEIPVSVYVAGMLSEGQKLYIENGHVYTDMSYEDFFPVYSYEQTEQVRMIIPEEEYKKISKENIFSVYWSIMINPDDELSAEERTAIWEKIVNYELEFTGLEFSAPYPSAKELVERNDILYRSILLKYLPLCIVVIILFSISIIGMVTIKTVKNSRCYGIMYTCGMQYSHVQLFTGLEMGFNCVLAFMATIVLLTLQKLFNIVGEINCNLETLELLFMLGICMITVVGSVLTTRGVLKEHTPVEILKNTN